MTKKISQLTPAAALDGTELVELEQASSSVRTTTQDIADLGGAGAGNEITGTSLVSGTITLAGADVLARDGHYGATNLYLYGGGVVTSGGDVTGSDPGAGLYLYGGEFDFRAGDITISGNASDASRIAGGHMFFLGGNATVDSGERPPNFKGGRVYFQSGTARETSVGDALGGQGAIEPGSGTDGGTVFFVAGGSSHPGGFGGNTTLQPGSSASGTNGHAALLDSAGNSIVQVGPTNGTLGFHGAAPVAQSAAGTTAADAIACLKAHGLMAT